MFFSFRKNTMNNNSIQATVSTPSSFKRKRDSSPQSSTPKEINPVSDQKTEELKASKLKLAKLANRQITEVKILSDNVTEILKVCYSGLEDYSNVSNEGTNFNSTDNLPTKFLATAHKLRSETARSKILANTVNLVLASCNKSSEALRAFRTQAIKNKFVTENDRLKRSTKISSKSSPKFLKMKKRIRFSSPIQSSNFNVSNVETDHEKIEINIPMKNENNEFSGNTVSITIENKRTEENLAKFRSNMTNEDVDFSTFQISQESEQLSDSSDTTTTVTSPTKFEESIDVETDTSEESASIIRFEEFSYFKPTKKWTNLTESERQQIDLTAPDRVDYFEKTVRKQVEKKVDLTIISPEKPENN